MRRGILAPMHLHALANPRGIWNDKRNKSVTIHEHFRYRNDYNNGGAE